MNKRKDSIISIAKGIAILLMVIGHSGCPIEMERFIYMFHMPFFFFISGYCFKAKYLESGIAFIRKRFVGLYVPYVVIGLVFLLFHNLFCRWGIYNGFYGFQGNVSSIYECRDYFDIIKQILLFNHAEQLIGGFWFLKNLFWGSILFYIALRLNKEPWIASVILLLSIGVAMKWHIGIPYLWIGSYDLYAAFFIMAGYFIKGLSKFLHGRQNIFFLLICCLFVSVGSFFFPSKFDQVTLSNVVFYTVFALSGCLMMLLFSSWLSRINRIVSVCLDYLGNHTLQILTWHFLGFKIASLTYIGVYGLNVLHLAEFPVIEASRQGLWWFLYTLCGVLLPLSLLGIVRVLKIKTIIGYGK